MQYISKIMLRITAHLDLSNLVVFLLVLRSSSRRSRGGSSFFGFVGTTTKKEPKTNEQFCSTCCCSPTCHHIIESFDKMLHNMSTIVGSSITTSTIPSASLRIHCVLDIISFLRSSYNFTLVKSVHIKSMKKCECWRQLCCETVVLRHQTFQEHIKFGSSTGNGFRQDGRKGK